MKLQRGDVVLLDFPFSDGTGGKVRPAVVVQADEWNARLDDTIVAMVTSSRHRQVNSTTQLFVAANSADAQKAGFRRGEGDAALFEQKFLPPGRDSLVHATKFSVKTKDHMAIEPPVVRYFLACHEVVVEPESGDVTLRRLIHAVAPLPGEQFPLRLDRMALWSLLSGGRGIHEVGVELTRFDVGAEFIVAAPSPRLVDFGQDPMAVIGLPIDLNGVEFETPGQYAFHLMCDGQRIATVDILVRDTQ